MWNSGLSSPQDVVTGWEEPSPGKGKGQEGPRGLGTSPNSLMEPPALPHPPSSSSPPLIHPFLSNSSLFT